MSRNWIIILAVIGFAAILLLGIEYSNRNSQPSQEEAVAALCSSLGELQTQATDLTNVDPSSTSTGQIQDDIDAMKGTWDDVKSDASDVKNATIDQLDSAWNSFESSASGISDSTSASDAKQTISSSVQTLGSDTKQTLSTLSCS